MDQPLCRIFARGSLRAGGAGGGRCRLAAGGGQVTFVEVGPQAQVEFVEQAAHVGLQEEGRSSGGCWAAAGAGRRRAAALPAAADAHIEVGYYSLGAPQQATTALHVLFEQRRLISHWPSAAVVAAGAVGCGARPGGAPAAELCSARLAASHNAHGGTWCGLSRSTRELQFLLVRCGVDRLYARQYQQQFSEGKGSGRGPFIQGLFEAAPDDDRAQRGQRSPGGRSSGHPGACNRPRLRL